MTHVWKVHAVLIGLVWAWAASMIVQTLDALQRGVFFHLIPETIVMAIAHALFSTLAVLALRTWLSSHRWPSPWAPRLLLVLAHFAVLVASGIGALASSDLVRSLT